MVQINWPSLQEKPDFVACKQQWLRPACASMQSDQGLCYSISKRYNSLTCSMQNFNILAGFDWSQTLQTVFLAMRPNYRVKSGKFRRSAKFGQRSCLFHILIIGIKNKLTKQKVKILMRRLIRSRLIWVSTVCKCMSEFTRCLKLPDFTLLAKGLI